MKRLLSIFVVTILIGLLSGCGDAAKGKKKKHSKGGKTAIIELDHGGAASVGLPPLAAAV
jgi:uncharacterized protein YceK